MVDEKMIARINELAKKSKTLGLSEVEKKEQLELRKSYIESLKCNLRSQLNNISIEEPDGTITDLGKKYGNKKGH